MNMTSLGLFRDLYVTAIGTKHEPACQVHMTIFLYKEVQEVHCMIFFICKVETEATLSVKHKFAWTKMLKDVIFQLYFVQKLHSP